MFSTAALHRRPSRPQIELADVFRRCTDRIPRLDGQQARVVRAILRCRTAVLGGHVQHCDSCGHSEIHYNSCRDRHGPKCQGSQQFRWIDAQQRHLLPVEYHHVVFTIPDRLHTILRANPRRAYGLFFAAVAETLQDVARNPKNLGAKIGLSCVLHTWTQILLYHPHIHCIVTGGGLHPDGDRWVAAKPGFFFPVRILSRLFRAKLKKRLTAVSVHVCTHNLTRPPNQDRRSPRRPQRRSVTTIPRRPSPLRPPTAPRSTTPG